MRQFIELPESKYIINIDLIIGLKPDFPKNNKWIIVYFPHNVMGTGNFYIEKKDYEYLYNILMGFDNNLVLD